MAKVKLPDKPRVAIYTRVSTLHQIDKDSLPMQRQDLINYARLILNTEDYVVYEDAGYSGKEYRPPKISGDDAAGQARDVHAYPRMENRPYQP